MRRIVLIGLLAALITACQPAARQTSTEVLPTLFPSPTPVGHDLESAGLVAATFLDAWQRGDFDAMYGLLSFASQEANPKDSFVSLYQASQGEMSLERLAFKANTLLRESPTIAVFNYDVTFSTTALGEFTDQSRDLNLVIDSRSDQWRVAWTAGDIFREMEGSGSLRLEHFDVNRGNIYDRTGDVVLADQNGRVVTVSVVKENVPQYDACFQALVQTTGRRPEVVQAILNRASANWETEIGTMEPTVYAARQGELEQVCGATFKPRLTRRYPNGTLASHVVGYVGYPDETELPELRTEGFNQDSILGKVGVERSWDRTLRGHPGGRLLIVSPTGETLRELTRTISQPQQSLWLTIDADLQQYVLQVIGEGYAKESWATTSKGASAVVMDVHTGEILAMVSWPTYDANAFAPFPAIGKDIAENMKKAVSEDPRIPLLNRVTLGAYPAGSVFKTVDAIAVADSGVFTPDQKLNCPDSWQREPNFVRYDWFVGGQGILTLPQAIQHSCNTYFYEVGYQLNQVDPFLLPSYAHKLGLGAPTGLRELQEAAGTIPDPDWLRETTANTATWTMSDAINMAIGQGYVQVTPLQIARLFAAIGNGGTFLRPQLVKQAGLVGEAPSFVMQPDVTSTVTIKPEVLDAVRTGLCSVTSVRGGTAEHIFRNSELQTIGVCGKTGTAQSAQPDEVSHAWFAAYAPRDDPQIAIVLMVENAGEGSAVAAPLVRRILEYYFFGTKS